MLLGISSDYLYFRSKTPINISDHHRPYFLVFSSNDIDIDSARSSLIKKWEKNTSETNPLSKIEDIGETETYNSFWDFEKRRKVFKIYTLKSAISTLSQTIN